MQADVAVRLFLKIQISNYVSLKQLNQFVLTWRKYLQITEKNLLLKGNIKK